VSKALPHAGKAFKTEAHCICSMLLQNQGEVQKLLMSLSGCELGRLVIFEIWIWKLPITHAIRQKKDFFIHDTKTQRGRKWR